MRKMEDFKVKINMGIKNGNETNKVTTEFSGESTQTQNRRNPRNRQYSENQGKRPTKGGGKTLWQ